MSKTSPTGNAMDLFGGNLDKTGQHYMIDSKLVKFIAEAGELSKDDVLLEVGYGQGALTCELVKSCEVVAVDIEQNALDINSKNLEIVTGNILDIFEKLHARHKFTKIVSNIPYNISEPLMRKIFKTKIQLIVLTVGKNFSDIITKEDNRIGIIANNIYGIEILQKVKPTSFNPRPKIDSAVIRLRMKNTVGSDIYRKLVFFDDLKLRNALIKVFYGKTKNEIKDLTDSKLFDKKLYELSNKEFIEFDKVVKSLL